jgi:hypothetical protein
MSRFDASENEKDNIGASAADGAARELPAAAKRALAEAEARRSARDAAAQSAPKEVGGSDGPDPVRYGDWEKSGIASDF